jgi:hypothetical protein
MYLVSMGMISTEEKDEERMNGGGSFECYAYDEGGSTE